MAAKLSLKFDSTICRVCLEDEGQVSLFDPKDNAENFRFITLLEAYDNDGLPQFLCLKCHVRLKVAHYFKTQAISANTQLKSYLTEINKKFTKIARNSKPYEDLENEIEEFNHILPENERIKFDKDIEEPIDDPLDDNSFEFYDADDPNQFENNTTKNVEYQIVIQPNKEISISDSSTLIKKSPQNIKKKLVKNENINKTSPQAISANTQRKVNDTFLCSICQNTFTTELNFKRHMEIHLKKRESFDCNICGKLFTQRASVKQHLLIHSGERPFACDECPKTFRRRKTLVGHKKSHKKEKLFECEHCMMKFSIKKSLINHINREHNDDGDPTVLYPCENCHKSYRSKYSLNDHILNQHTSKSKPINPHKCTESETSYSIHRCSQCPAIFHSKRTLNSHMEIHETNENFKCNICDEIFGRKYKLLLHMQEHEKNTNENNFSCRKCKKEFSILENLYEHLRAHKQTDNEKFKCLHCDERSISKSGLKAHIVSEHKNEFKEWNICASCDLTFLTFDTYYDHIIQNHSPCFDGDCRECGACFETQEELNEHTMEHDVISNNE